MTDQANPSSAPASRAQGFWRRRGLPIALILVLASGLAAAFVSQAMSQDQGSGPWHGGWHGPGFMHGPLTPEQIEDRVDRGIRHVAIELDATPEQQEKLRTIAKAAVKDLLPMREKAKTAHARADELLTQPKIDRAAIEALRTELMSTADAASKRFAQAVTDVAEVLTPEQRQKAHEWLQSRRSFWRRWHRG